MDAEIKMRKPIMRHCRNNKIKKEKTKLADRKETMPYISHQIR